MSRKPEEIELRLATTDAAMRRLPNLAALASLTVSSAETRDVLSVYWDTPKFHLHDSRLALRLRRTGNGGWIQTLKAETQVPQTRAEYEGPVSGTRPDLELAHRQGWPRDADLVTLEHQLRPIFRTRVKRTVRTLRFDDGTVAELALDRGELSVESARTAPERISEIEIELVTGNACRLYELALRLITDLSSTRVLFASKSQRGYELLAATPPPARRARAIHIPRKSTAALVAYRATAESLVHVQSNSEGARAGNDAEAVHQMRVGVRRLRATAAIARKAGLPSFSDKMRGELKWLWQLLGEARDWDVFETETWPDVKRKARNEAASATAFEAAVSALRDTSHRALRRALDGRRFQGIVLALGWINTLQREEMSRDAGKRSSKQLARQLLSRRAKRIQNVDIAGLSSEERHRLRIDAKKLRYLAEFVAGRYPARSTGRYLRRLAAVQTSLGALNDIAVTGKRIQVAASSLPLAERSSVAENWKRYATGRVPMLEAQFVEQWKKFAKARPFWK